MPNLINKKREENNKNTNKKDTKVKTNNWKKFGFGVITNLIITIIISILGVNFIFFTRGITSEKLNKIFPSDCNKLPYCCYNDNKTSCKIVKNPLQQGGSNNIRGGTTKVPGYPVCGSKNYPGSDSSATKNDFAFPYNLSTDDDGYFAEAKNWVANSIARSFASGREGIKIFFDIFSDESIFAKYDNILLLIGPLFFLLLSIIIPIYGFGSTLWFEFASGSGWVWGVLFTFVFGLTILIPSGVAVAQLIQMVFIFLFVPFMEGIKTVKEIFRCKYQIFVFLFGALVCGTAYSTLDDTVATPMLLVYLIYLLKYIFF